MNEILAFKDISLNYQSLSGEIPAIEHISFSVKEGEFIAFIGPSGCGKTTVLSLIAGLLKPSSGEIILDGKLLTKPTFDIGYMLQSDQLFSWRSIYQNVCLGLEIRHAKNTDNLRHIDGLLQKYGLWEFKNAKPSQLSGGMRQRVALIRTLALKPKLLLLDEPFSALDYQTRLRVCDDVFRIISSEKQTAILVTHDIAEAISLADRVFVLSKRPGKIKNVYQTCCRDFGSPLRRREHPEFPKLFEKIYKEISDDEQAI